MEKMCESHYDDGNEKEKRTMRVNRKSGFMMILTMMTVWLAVTVLGPYNRNVRIKFACIVENE